MSKKTKILLIIAMTTLLFVWWLLLAVTHTKGQTLNYAWQGGQAAQAIIIGLLGILTAKHWSWLKSNVGQAVFFVSLGLIAWGIGQAGWTALVLQNPDIESPPNHLLDIAFLAAIPCWFFGVLRLSKATGAKYAFRNLWAKVFVATGILATLAFSYYILFVVSQQNIGDFLHESFWKAFFDLSYPIGDSVNLALALVIFGLSWKYLGGMFKRPVLLTLLGLVAIFVADFFFSYYDLKSQYYNGHWVDLLFLAMAAIFGCGLCLLDPTRRKVAEHSAVAEVTKASPEEALAALAAATVSGADVMTQANVIPEASPLADTVNRPEAAPTAEPTQPVMPAAQETTQVAAPISAPEPKSQPEAEQVIQAAPPASSTQASGGPEAAAVVQVEPTPLPPAPGSASNPTAQQPSTPDSTKPSQGGTA